MGATTQAVGRLCMMACRLGTVWLQIQKMILGRRDAATQMLFARSAAERETTSGLDWPHHVPPRTKRLIP
jgi:hypothetical protein